MTIHRSFSIKSLMDIYLPVLHHFPVDPCSIYRSDFIKERFRDAKAVTKSQSLLSMIQKS